MTHRIAVIGGDGIGPQVTAEALKVVRAAGVDLDTTAFDLGALVTSAIGTILPDDVLGELADVRRHPPGAVGTPEVPPGVIEPGMAAELRFDLDLYVNQRPFQGTAPGHDRAHDFIVIRENTEGPYVGEGGLLAQGHAPRGGDAGQRQHPPRRRALRALRLRAGAAPAAPDPGAQDQRAHLRRRPVAAHLRRRGRRPPRNADRLQPRGRGLHLLRAGPPPLRRDRHGQPVRRHPDGPGAAR